MVHIPGFKHCKKFVFDSDVHLSGRILTHTYRFRNILLFTLRNGKLYSQEFFSEKIRGTSSATKASKHTPELSLETCCFD